MAERPGDSASESVSEDPEFSRLKRDFAATLPARARVLRELAAAGRDAEIVFHCHKLAGVAGSYGFHALTEGADLLEAKVPALGSGHPMIAAAIAWLVDCLESSAARGEEPAEASQSPSLQTLRKLAAP